MSYSVNASPMASDKDEILSKQRLQFAHSLKDLKNLKRQLYSAADCFESSYNKDNHKQFVVESSREYVGKALVSTVDHLGSVANKLNKIFDEKSHEFSATIVQLSLIEQKLSTLQGFIYLKGLSQHFSKIGASASSQHKHHILPAEESCASGKPKVQYTNCVSSVPYNVQQPEQENLFSKALQGTKMKLDPPVLRKKEPRRASREPSPNPAGFSLSRILASKEAGRRSVSPLRFPYLSGSMIKRSVSPTPSCSKGRWAAEPRRAISACRRRQDEMISNKEIEESYTKRSKHLFKALLTLHHSRKDNVLKQIIQA